MDVRSETVRRAGSSAEPALAADVDAPLRPGSVSEELFAKAALAARLAFILDSLPTMVVVVGASGLVLQLSRPAAELTGLRTGESWSLFTNRLIPSPAIDEFFLGDTCLRLLESVTAVGERIYTLTNTTERSEERRRIERERQLIGLGHFAAHLSHQLRTPLSSAILYAGLLAQPQLSNSQRLMYADTVGGRLRHMRDLIANAVDNLGTEPLSAPEPINIAELAGGVVMAMSALAARMQVRLRLEFPAGRDACGWVTGWKVPLEGALTNLIDNALHASGAGAQVIVSCEPGAEQVDLVVRDHGCGMDADTIAHLFEPFFTRRSNGTGLGLPFVRGVADRHGGTVRVESTLDRGSVFTLSIPRTPPTRPASGSSALAAQRFEFAEGAR